MTYLRRLIKSDLRLTFFVYALLIGVFTGFIISAFRLLVEQGFALTVQLYKQAHQTPSILLFLVLGGVIVSLLAGWLMRLDPNIKGAGIPQVEAQLSGLLEVSWLSVVWKKFIASALTVSTGIFVGREGPSVQMGAALGQGVAEHAGLHGSSRRILISAGASAGLASAFNAPIAGTFFVMEEIYHNFSPLVWISAMTSAISANFIALNIFGLKPILPINITHAFPLADYWIVILLSVLLGAMSLAYQQGLLKTPALYDRLTKIPWYLRGLIPMILVVPIGYYFAQTLGSGSILIEQLVTNEHSLLLLVILIIVRYFFSMTSYGAGVVGGFFMPILTMGALTGALLGQVFIDLHWFSQPYLANLIVFGMAGCFAGVSKAPFSAIMLITELTGSLQNFMPVAMVALLTYLIVDFFGAAPIYEVLAERLGTIKATATIGRTDTLHLSVFPKSQVEDQQVRDVDWPSGTLLTTVIRGRHQVFPRADLILSAGDELIFTTAQADFAVNRKALITLTQQ